MLCQIGNYCSCCGLDLTLTDDFGRLAMPFVSRGGVVWCLECHTFLFEKFDSDDLRAIAYRVGKKDWYLADQKKDIIVRPQWIEDFINTRKGFSLIK